MFVKDGLAEWMGVAKGFWVAPTFSFVYPEAVDWLRVCSVLALVDWAGVISSFSSDVRVEGESWDIWWEAMFCSGGREECSERTEVETSQAIQRLLEE